MLRDLDNTQKFRNFKESIPKNVGSLPIIPVVNPKTVFLNWLEYKINNMKLKSPVALAGDYPSQQMITELTTDNVGEIVVPNPRGIAVVLLDGSVTEKGIGEVLEGDEVVDTQGNPIGIKYGWVETLDMEFTYWSVSSRDRDYGGELVRSMIFEAHRSGFLLNNGIISLELKNHYDSADNRLASQNRYVQYSISVFSVRRYFWGTVNYENAYPLIEGFDVDMETSAMDGDAQAPHISTSTYKDGRAGHNLESTDFPDILYEKSYVLCYGSQMQQDSDKPKHIKAKEYGICYG